MEEIPFSSGDNDKDTSNNFEAFDDDDEEEEETSETSERSLFGKTSGEAVKDENNEESEAKRSIFASLLKDKESKHEPAEHDEMDQFVGSVENDETQTNQEFQEVVEDRLDNVETSILGAGQEEVAELTADASFLSSVGERMAEGLPPQEAINEAMAESMGEQNVEQPLGNGNQTEQEITDPETEDFVASPPQQVAKSTRSSSRSPSSPPPIIPPTLTPASFTPGSRGNRGGGSGAGGGGYSPAPPNPNVTPSASQGPNTLNPNLSPDSPDVSRMNQLYYRDRRRGDLLLGGAIGYLFGRRRGRKKAEARLGPEISDRDTTIDSLKGDLERSEAAVRKTASKINEKVVTIELPSTNMEEKDIKLSRPEKIPAKPLSKELKEIIAQENAFEKTLAPEKDTSNEVKLEQKTLYNESIPELAYDVGVEQAKAKQAAKEELNMIRKEQAEKKRATGTEIFSEKKKNVRLMSTKELLEIADNIRLDSIPLRKLYETGRIDELGLRRVITEYVHGKNYEKVLRGSLESVELRGEKRAEFNKGDQRFEKLSTVRPNENAENQIFRAPQPSVNVVQIKNSSHEDHVSETIERNASLQVSNTTAIAIGVFSGIAIVLLAILYSNSL